MGRKQNDAKLIVDGLDLVAIIRGVVVAVMFVIQLDGPQVAQELAGLELLGGVGFDGGGPRGFALAAGLLMLSDGFHPLAMQRRPKDESFRHLVLVAIEGFELLLVLAHHPVARRALPAEGAAPRDIALRPLAIFANDDCSLGGAIHSEASGRRLPTW